MLKNNLKYIVFLFTLILISCAKRGTITGGFKDTLAPILKSSLPKNFSTNFKGNEIKLTFDEYIKLKDLNKQLIVSPPMKSAPLILPTNASKYISIKINDTLQPNTTYSFNFGQSIQDNNEGNPFNQFKYIFSTGNHIDSLSLNGTVKDAYNREVESFISVMLYEVNDQFKDSVVYNHTPRYITNTLDSLKTFKLENIKAGKYLLVAMKDLGSNNKFNPAKDKIGFHKSFITIPNDSIYELKIFKETLPLKVFKPIQASNNRLILPYQGKAKDLKINLKNGESVIPTLITQFPKKDSLQVWFPPVKADSLSLSTSKGNYKADFVMKLKNQKKDSLKIKPIRDGQLNPRDRYGFEINTPLVKFDNSKIKIMYKDSVSVDFKTVYDDFNQQLFLDFKTEPSENYTFTLLPGALTDYLEKSNDTLVFKANTRSLFDFGNLVLNVQNIKRYPIILELTNENGTTLAKEYRKEHSENNLKIEFIGLEPAKFWLRAIYDDNKNEEYDSGNYLEKQQAEEVIYYSKTVDVRANWDVEQVFDLNIPYTPEPKNNKDKKKRTN